MVTVLTLSLVFKFFIIARGKINMLFTTLYGRPLELKTVTSFELENAPGPGKHFQGPRSQFFTLDEPTLSQKIPF